MPVANKPATSMALLPQPQASDTQAEGNSENVTQPRQPTSLQGLLRFAMESTKADDAPHNSEFQPMDAERKQFLENALRSMTVDVVEVLQKQIDIVRKVEQIEATEDVTEYSDAIEVILEHVDNIDVANDFHKIGGFMILYPCLKCKHPKIRAGGCELLAVLCQNNPYCQKIVLDNEFIPMLVNMIEKDEDMQVAIKALYALSSIIRDNVEGFNQLVHYNGLLVLLNTLKKNYDKFIIKATFMLSALCRSTPELKNQLINLNYLPTLISLVSTERSPSHEHVLSLLVCLVEDSPKALEECKSPKYNLKEIIQKYISNVKNKEEYQEEEEYCKRLLHILNSAD